MRMTHKLALGAATALFAIGSFAFADDATVSNGMTVTFQYKMFAEGKLVSEATAEKPMKYLHGQSRGMVAAVGEKLEGKKVGDEVKFSLPPEKAFGPVDPEEIETIAKADLPADHTFTVCEKVAIPSPLPGIIPPKRGVVKEVKADGSIVIDWNHPLAGKTIDLEVKILSIQKADQ